MTDWSHFFPGRLDVAPPIAEGALAALPAKRGIVLLAAGEDRPLLLLTAADIRSRTGRRLANPDEQERSRLPDLQCITRSIRWRLSHSRFEADWDYLEAARLLWPRDWAQLLSWKPPWFVLADVTGPFPHFERVRGPCGGGGTYLGPFPSASSAQAFVEALEDAFDLCRHAVCLRQSPHGRRCSYAEMGRCLCPCDGSIAMADYARAVAEALEFALGNRQPLRARLGEAMGEAAARLQFEAAAVYKARLARLEEFDRPEYRYVAALDDFRFILVQGGPRSGTAKVFFVHGGRIESAATLVRPLQGPAVQTLLDAMAAWVIQPAATDDAGPWRMGLVSHYLFAGPAGENEGPPAPVAEEEPLVPPIPNSPPPGEVRAPKPVLVRKSAACAIVRYNSSLTAAELMKAIDASGLLRPAARRGEGNRQ